MNCEIPYRDVDSSAIIWGVGNSSLTLPIPSGVPRGFDLLLQQCWNIKPRNRPSFRQVLMHLDIASSELINIEANQFFIIQQQWRDEIRDCMKRMKRRRSSVAISNEHQINNENYKEEVIIIIQDLKNRRQNLIEQKTLFPKETAEVAAKYSVSALCGTLASGVVMSTPSSLGIWAGTMVAATIGEKLACKTFNFCYNSLKRRKSI